MDLSHYERRVSMAADNRTGWHDSDNSGGHEVLHRILSTVPEVVRTGAARERSQAALKGGAHPPGAEAHALWRESVNVAATGKQWDRPVPDVLIHGGDAPDSLSHATPSVSHAVVSGPANTGHRRRYAAAFAAFAVAGICAGWYATKGSHRARYFPPDGDSSDDRRSE